MFIRSKNIHPTGAMTVSHGYNSAVDPLTDHPPSSGFPLADQDPVEAYFECITTCSIDDGECVTTCTEILRQHS
jgi:hypothetical protein